MYFHHECYLFFWQHIKYSIEPVQCFCGELFPHSIHSSSNCFPRQRFSHSHITFDAVIFQKKNTFLFVILMPGWERLCVGGKGKKQMWTLCMDWGTEVGTLLIDLLWRKQHFAQIEMLMRWFFTLAKNVMRQRILNTNEQTENVIETVATWHYRIQLIMQIQWSEAVTWSTTSMEKCFNQHVHWFPSFHYLSHRRAALQLNSWMEIATFIDVDMKSDKMSLWSVSKLWLKASMFSAEINDMKANNYFYITSHISLWIIYFQSILLSDSWQIKRM